MADALFQIWFLTTCSDALAAILAAVLLYRLRTRLGRYGALLMAGFAVESVLAAVSLVLLFPDEVHVMPAFAIVRSVGRGVKSAAVWVFVLYLLGFMNGVHKSLTPDK